MDTEGRDRIERVIQGEAEESFPGAVRRVTVVQADELVELDEQGRRFERGDFEPGELVPQIVLAEPSGTRQGQFEPPFYSGHSATTMARR